MLKAQLSDSFSSFLLIPAMDSNRRTSWNSALATSHFHFRAGAIRCVFDFGTLLHWWVIWKFFNAWIRHGEITYIVDSIQLALRALAMNLQILHKFVLIVASYMQQITEARFTKEGRGIRTVIICVQTR